jgi:ribose-phosphate pyrophosphokinase
MNLHAPQVHGFFSVPVDHLTALGVLADHFRGQDLDDAVVVSPDLGNAKDATQFSRLLGLPVAAGSQARLADDRVVIDAIVGDVEASGRSCSTTRSPPAARSSSCSTGSPTRACTEAPSPAPTGCSPAAVERLRGHPMISEVVTTDTVPRPADWPELEVAVGGRLFAEAIKRIHEGESVFEPVRRRRPDPRPAPPSGPSFDRVRS